MTAKAILNQTAQYFGGATYDNNTRAYRNPTVPGIGVVRRAFAKRYDRADFYNGQPPGTTHGTQMVVEIMGGSEQREAMAGATSGLKYCMYDMQLHLFILSDDQYAEDALDFVYDVRDNVIAKIRADRTLGSGGFEAGVGVGFMVGEGGHPWIKWTHGHGVTKAEGTEYYCMIEFQAHQFDQA